MSDNPLDTEALPPAYERIAQKAAETGGNYLLPIAARTDWDWHAAIVARIAYLRTMSDLTRPLVRSDER